MRLQIPRDDTASSLATVDWTPTRAAGLQRLEAFLPMAGRAYARDRNVDRGPADRSNVSALSPWIRRRLITEEEVIAAVLKRQGFVAAEKFIQEVFWRSYWKGWLEMRPSALTRYEADLEKLRSSWADDAELQRALEGRTGIDCFDAWVKDLVEIGWLHNHARMWMASIWIFTLRLPWQLGAAFFYEHLIDADPASNTLSWRWVAGLHMVGKHYLARASNIRDNTLGRFDPSGQLDERAPPLTEDGRHPTPAPLPVGDSETTERVVLLLTEEDLHPESWGIQAQVAGCAALVQHDATDVQSPARSFGRGALQDGLTRASAHFSTDSTSLDIGDVASWAMRLGVKEVVTSFAATGPLARTLAELQHDWAGHDIRLVRLQRPFDRRVWPHATAGFFKLKEAIPRLVAGMA